MDSTSKVKTCLLKVVNNTMSHRNPQGRGRDGTQQAIPPETISSGRTGGRFGRGGG